LAEFSRRRRWYPFPDVPDALRQLAVRVPLYVLANWDADLPVVLRNASLDGFFRDALSSEMLGYEKPERACFEAFLSRTSLAPSGTLYVGNEYIADVIGARDAGLTPLLVDRGGKMQSADCIRVSSFTELTTALYNFLPEQSDSKGTLRLCQGHGQC
jgi:FMN phosphatase YigB (HAD superfamily)